VLLAVAAICVLALAVVSATTCSRGEFEAFKARFKKQYSDQAEEQARFAVFCASLDRVAKKNKNAGEAGVWSITKFSDLTPAEFRRIYLGGRPRNGTLVSTTTRKVAPGAPNPPAFDWRSSSKKILTPVYNQGQCGSCWAFSATENIESQWALAGNSLVELAPQQLVDCDSQSDGCGGGYTQSAYETIISEGGQESKADYPYTGRNGQCQFDKNKVAAKISSWENVYPGNEDQMATWLAASGPVSICVDASQWSDYGGGIMKASQCGNQIDHCVLLVGYDTSKSPAYWIVRNSWGKDWGVEKGFIYLEYGTNTCNLANEPTSAKV